MLLYLAVKAGYAKAVRLSLSVSKHSSSDTRFVKGRQCASHDLTLSVILADSHAR